MDRGQLIFFGAAAIFMAYEVFTGWRLGLIRQIVRLCALAAACLAGVFFGGAVTPVLRFTGYPDLLLQPVAGVLLGIVAYLIVGLVGRILFRKTTDQEFGIVWLFYGVTGALCGAVFGLVFVFMAAVALRFLGTLATGLATKPAALTYQQDASGLQRTAGRPPARPNRAVSGLIEMKHSLEGGITGGVLETIDPIPEKFYVMVEKIGRIAGSPDAINRFLSYPGAAELISRPELSSLRDDPKIATAVREGKYFSLLKNERIVAAANDPKIAGLIKKFDLEKALNYATEKTAAEP